jgi:hypothetical protein
MDSLNHRRHRIIPRNDIKHFISYLSKDKCSIYVLVNSNISIIDIGSYESIHFFLNPLPLCEADGIEFNIELSRNFNFN